MILVGKFTKFSQKEAQRIMQQHEGMLGFARYNRHADPDRRCEVGKLIQVGDAHALGYGRSFRKALEDAGVYFKTGDWIT